LASRAKSMASIERGMLSGSTWAWKSITPLSLDFDCAAEASRPEQSTAHVNHKIARYLDRKFIMPKILSRISVRGSYFGLGQALFARSSSSRPNRTCDATSGLAALLTSSV
jgi:hypothetical protein